MFVCVCVRKTGARAQEWRKARLNENTGVVRYPIDPNFICFVSFFGSRSLALSKVVFLGNLVAKKLVALNRSTRDHTLKTTVTQIYSYFLTLTAHANVEKYPFYSLKKRI